MMQFTCFLVSGPWYHSSWYGVFPFGFFKSSSSSSCARLDASALSNGPGLKQRKFTHNPKDLKDSWWYPSVAYPKVYILVPKRHTLIQVLPPANAYTKLFATCSCIFTYLFVGHSCIYAINPVCVHHGVCTGCLIAILRQNPYMHEQITKQIWGEEVPVWVYAFWVCKPVYQVFYIDLFKVIYYVLLMVSKGGHKANSKESLVKSPRLVLNNLRINKVSSSYS